MSNKKPTKKKETRKKITTMKILVETKSRLEKLREHKKESYDDILRKILYVLNTAREDPDKAKRTLERIEEIRVQNLEEEEERKEDLKKERKNSKK